MARQVKVPGEKLSVRMVRKGDVVRLPDGVEEVVRDVQIVLQLANGSNPTFAPVEFVELLPPEELPAER